MCLMKITYIKFTFFHNYCTYRWKNTSHSSSLQDKRWIVNPLMTIVLSQTSGVHKSIEVIQKLFLLIPHHVSSTPTHHLWTKPILLKLLATQKEEGTYSSLLCPITHIHISYNHSYHASMLDHQGMDAKFFEEQSSSLYPQFHVIVVSVMMI